MTDYTTLRRVLGAAYDQAANGKGKERHAQDLRFDQQPIMQITRTHGEGFPMGQAAKKIQEAARLSPEHARHELLGAIVYLAAAYLYLEEQQASEETP